ncbi:zinc finger protein 660-like [Chrysoperla carnea]|uniref:zinc finger protein 660-like n=1 Tax=Chrysoperla carnea TaxID=189513 RepID=UPI001D06AB83|nr:zinc finger protein 660-like [Chrysoperla carnea]
MDFQCLSVSDFGKICRICMKFADTFLAITSFEIINMISSCSSVQIWENDGLPNQICKTCFLQLQNSINFKLLCETSDTTFRQIIEQNQIKLETDITDDAIKNEEIENLSSFNDLSSNVIKSDDIEVKFEDDFNDNESLSSSLSEKLSNNEHDIEGEVLETLTCEKCSKEFKKAWVLGQHMHRAHRAKGLKCSKCEMKCYHVLHLKEHDELTHNPLNHTCDVCKKRFTNIYQLKRHKFRHSGRLLNCQQCDKSFKDKWALKRHKKEMHSHIEKNAACHVCGKSVSKKNLSSHMQIHKSERHKLTCEICLKTFLHRQSLEDHVKIKHNNQIPKHNYLCNVCGIASRSPAALRRHTLSHTKEQAYACDHCDKTYRRQDALKKHVSRAHLDERKYVCTFCSKAFYENSILLNHVRRHTGERPFKCHVCDKTFIQKVALTIHMKTHTNST